MNELSPEAHDVLTSARRATSGPTPAQRARMRNAVLITAASSSAAASAWAATAKLVMVGVVSAAVGATVTAGVMRRTAPPTAPVAAPTPARAHRQAPESSPVAPEPSPPPRPVLAAAPAPQRSSPPQATTPTPPAPSSAAPEPHAVAEAPPSTPAVPGPTLGDEVRALSSAMRAADALEWTEALAALDAYARDFPHGALREEAEVVRVRALCGAGRVKEGDALAAQLAAQAPNNPAVQRLRAGCLTDAGAR